MTGDVTRVTGPLGWEPAQVTPPEVPMLPPGEDPMSAMISATLPTLGASMHANVAALTAKEHTYNGKLAAATAQYQNADEQGEQGVMQIVQMLGQMGEQAGQMGEMAGAPAQLGGQLMQPLMQAMQQGGGMGGGAGGGHGAGGGAGGGQGPSGMSGPQQQGHDDGGRAEARPQPQQHADEDDQAMAGPGETRHGLSPNPPLPPEFSRHGDGEDLSRRA
jgi:hypothetical protein